MIWCVFCKRSVCVRVQAQPRAGYAHSQSERVSDVVATDGVLALAGSRPPAHDMQET
jgi:hypothetical protein